MADGFLENHQFDYEKRKIAWLKKMRSFSYQLKLNNNGKNATDTSR